MRKFSFVMYFLSISLFSSFIDTVHADDVKPVTVGVILPFSSAFESIAAEQKNPIEMALSDMDAEIKVIYQDGKNNSEGAIAALNELMISETPPQAVITCASWVASVINPLAAEKGVFHIAIGSAALNRTSKKNTIRFTLDVKQEEDMLALYLSLFKRIAIIYG